MPRGEKYRKMFRVFSKQMKLVIMKKTYTAATASYKINIRLNVMVFNRCFTVATDYGWYFCSIRFSLPLILVICLDRFSRESLKAYTFYTIYIIRLNILTALVHFEWKLSNNFGFEVYRMATFSHICILEL